MVSNDDTTQTSVLSPDCTKSRKTVKDWQACAQQSAERQARLSAGSLPCSLQRLSFGSRAAGRARDREKKQILDISDQHLKINKAARRPMPRFSTPYCKWEGGPTADAGVATRSPSVV